MCINSVQCSTRPHAAGRVQRSLDAVTTKQVVRVVDLHVDLRVVLKITPRPPTLPRCRSTTMQDQLPNPLHAARLVVHARTRCSPKRRIACSRLPSFTSTVLFGAVAYDLHDSTKNLLGSRDYFSPFGLDLFDGRKPSARLRTLTVTTVMPGRIDSCHGRCREVLHFHWVTFILSSVRHLFACAVDDRVVTRWPDDLVPVLGKHQDWVLPSAVSVYRYNHVDLHIV